MPNEIIIREDPILKFLKTIDIYLNEIDMLEEDHFQSHDKCLKFLIRKQLGASLECPECIKYNRFSRDNSVPVLKKVKSRNVYQCSHFDCKLQYSPIAHSVFRKSTIPLNICFYILYEFQNGKNVRNIRKGIEDKYTQKITAYKVRNLIRRFKQAPTRGQVKNELNLTINCIRKQLIKLKKEYPKHFLLCELMEYVPPKDNI